MRGKVRFPVATLVLCLVSVCLAVAGELEDRLINEAINGNADAVRALLNKGADVNAKDGNAETVLMKAAYYGYADVVRVLIEKGASVEAKNNSGETALQLAGKRNQSAVVQLLQQALSKDSRANFTAAVNDFQHDPYNDANRERVVKAAAGLPSQPAIPEDARQPFVQATTLLQNIRTAQTSTPKDLYQPIVLLRKALEIAPWWGDAYYNLSRALELSGQYDDAIKQLNYYLELKLSEADAADARTKIAVFQTEKEAAARRRQENESAASVRYISGGATRLRRADAPPWWRPDGFGGIVTLYVYGIPEEDPLYLNTFRFPNGRILVVFLEAKSNSGSYAGDDIHVLDLTAEGCTQGYHFAFGTSDSFDACGFHYLVNVSSPPNATVIVRHPATGGSVTVPVALLYRGRALKGAWDGRVLQGGADVKVLTFDSNVVNAAHDPNVNAMGLTPLSVTPYQGDKK